jgi:hypothetical protein
MMDAQLASYWKEAGRRFGFRVISPYTLSLNNVSISVAALLPEFGAPQGMLLVSDYSQLQGYLQDIEVAGYGFSVLSADGSEPVRSSVVEVLADWGWSGQGPEPSWLHGP